MAGLRDVFFDTSVLIAGVIDFGRGPHHALLLMDAVAAGRIERPMTAWHCCLEFYSVTTRLPEEYRLDPDVALRLLREEILARGAVAARTAAAGTSSTGAVRGFGTAPGCSCASATEATRSAR